MLTTEVTRSVEFGLSSSEQKYPERKNMRRETRTYKLMYLSLPALWFQPTNPIMWSRSRTWRRTTSRIVVCGQPEWLYSYLSEGNGHFLKGASMTTHKASLSIQNLIAILSRLGNRKEEKGPCRLLLPGQPDPLKTPHANP